MKTIFVASAPRSGSTWFGNILNSHPDSIYRHEPLARLSNLTDSALLHDLKNRYQLSAAEKERLMQLLLIPNIATTRPPFFSKSYLMIHPKLQYFLWVIARKQNFFRNFFSKTMLPSEDKKSCLVIKETGWSVHLESILSGVNPDHTIFILRHPCAIINSIINGIKKGLMRTQTSDMKSLWFRNHQYFNYIIDNSINEEQLMAMDDITFWAVRLRVLYDLFMDILRKDSLRCSLVVYENLQANPMVEMGKIFDRLDIPFRNEVTSFVKSSSLSGRPRLLCDSMESYFSVHRSASFDPLQWQTQLSAQTVIAIEEIVGRELLGQYWPD